MSAAGSGKGLVRSASVYPSFGGRQLLRFRPRFRTKRSVPPPRTEGSASVPLDTLNEALRPGHQFNRRQSNASPRGSASINPAAEGSASGWKVGLKRFRLVGETEALGRAVFNHHRPEGRARRLRGLDFSTGGMEEEALPFFKPWNPPRPRDGLHLNHQNEALRS